MRFNRTFLLPLLYLCSSVFVLRAQHINRLHCNNGCNYIAESVPADIIEFTPDIETLNSFNKILSLGLLPLQNINLAASSVDYAVAFVNPNNNSRNVFYNQKALSDLEKKTHSKFTTICILAHEQGHHLLGNTYDQIGRDKDIELEADSYSGQVLFLMGCREQEATLALEMLSSDSITSTHPLKRERIAALINGWHKAKDTFKTPIQPTETPKVAVSDCKEQYGALILKNNMSTRIRVEVVDAKSDMTLRTVGINVKEQMSLALPGSHTYIYRVWSDNEAQYSTNMLLERYISLANCKTSIEQIPK